MSSDPLLLARLVAALAIAQAFLSPLARALGRPLRWRVALGAHLVALLFLLPWLTGRDLVVPTSFLVQQVPGASNDLRPDAHATQLNDVVLQLVPWEMEVRRAFADGRLPLWSDLADGGSSLVANPQATVLSPIALLARLAPIEHHHLFALALAVVVAFQGGYVAARRFGVRRPGAIATATTTSLGGGLLAWGLFPLGAAAAWVPWSLAASIAVWRDRSRWPVVGAICAFAALLSAGHPEIALAGVSVSLVVAFAVRRRSAPPLPRVAAMAFAGIAAFSISAPTNLPFLASIPESQRFSEIEENRASPPIDSLGAELVPSQPKLALGPLSPFTFGVPYIDSTGIPGEPIHAYATYAGFVAIAGVAILLVTFGLPRRALLLLSIVALVYALFVEIPVAVRVWKAIPLYGLIVPNRLLPIAGLSLALVGGLGIDRLLRHPRPSSPSLAILLLLLASSATHFSRTVIALATGLVVATFLARRRPRWSAALVLALALLDQVRWGRTLIPRGSPDLFFPATPEMAELQRALGENGRIVGHDFLLYPNLASAYGWSDPRPHNPVSSRRLSGVFSAAFDFSPSGARYFDHFLHPEHPFLDFLAVTVVFTNDALPAIPGMERHRLGGSILAFAENREALPRLFLTDAWNAVEPPSLAAWIRAMSDPRRIAVSPAAGTRLAQGGPLSTGDLRIASWRPGSIELDLPPAEQKLVASSIPGPRGWRAEDRDSGDPLELIEVDGAFLGLVAPAGAAHVALSYRPPGFAAGCWLAALGALALLGAARRARA